MYSASNELRADNCYFGESLRPREKASGNNRNNNFQNEISSTPGSGKMVDN